MRLRVRGYRHAASGECYRDGLRQRVHVQRFAIQHDPEIDCFWCVVFAILM